MSLYLNDVGIVCALGSGQRAVRDALLGERVGGVAEYDDLLPGRRLHLGRANVPLADIGMLPMEQRSRNNALLLTALEQIRQPVEEVLERFGADRIGIVLGTSTSGIGESEQAFAWKRAHGELPRDFHVAQQELGSPAQMLAGVLGVTGPSYVISTACSSSAKALASAARLISSGICDAVLCGGMDALCAFTVAGFSSLDSVSEARCNPMSVNRCGINIGEGGALFLMTREPGPVRLAGWGESVDAYHISAPDPTGSGARRAMEAALARAGLEPAQIGYINLHGTATEQNDAMESRAVSKLFGGRMPCSSTKPLTGHTLGGAGALEAALCWLTLHENPEGRLPAHWWDGSADPALPSLDLVEPGRKSCMPDYVLSNSFAFGGSNAALILGRG